MSLISIGIPTYNRREIVYKNVIYTLSNIESTDFEIVVVDNASEDGTFDKLSKIKDKRFRLFRNNINLGITRNVYKVIEYAKSQFVLMLSDEDFVSVEMFKCLLHRLKSNFNLYNKFGVILYGNHLPLGNLKRGEELYSVLLENDYFSGNIFNKYFLNKIDYLDYNTLYPHTNISLKLSQVSEVLFINKNIFFSFTKDKKSYIKGNFFHPCGVLDILKERVDIIKNFKFLSHIEFISLLSLLHIKFVNSINTYDVYLRSNFYREYYNLENKKYSFSDACDYLLKYEEFFFNNIKSLGINSENISKTIIEYDTNIINTLSIRFKFDVLIKMGYKAYILNSYDKSIFDEFNLEVSILDKSISDLDCMSILIIEKDEFKKISDINKKIILVDCDKLLSFCTYLYPIIKSVRDQDKCKYVDLKN